MQFACNAMHQLLKVFHRSSNQINKNLKEDSSLLFSSRTKLNSSAFTLSLLRSFSPPFFSFSPCFAGVWDFVRFSYFNIKEYVCSSFI